MIREGISNSVHLICFVSTVTNDGEHKSTFNNHHHQLYLISDDEDGNDEEEGARTTKRKREKLTRAQLNKRKARNMATHEDFKKKEVKDLLKSLDSLPRVIKSIEADEKRLEDMKAIREVGRKHETEMKLCPQDRQL